MSPAQPDQSTPGPTDHLAHHLLAALALSHSTDPQAASDFDAHWAELNRLPSHSPFSAGVIAQLAQAARERRDGKELAALRGFESAGAAAASQGIAWLAALAWEQAALLADQCGLGAAASHYRRQALDADGLGDLGLSIAHEINQPLAAISLHAVAARKWLRRAQPDIERAVSSLALISAAGRQAGDIVRGLQRLAARQQTEMASVAVDQAIAETLESLQRQMRKHGIGIELALGLGTYTIRASRVQLQQVLTNLLVNASEALSGSEAGLVPKTIRVASRRFGEGEVEITVSDNGPGIAPGNRERIFSSLFSTKPNNTGMGLSISLAIVRAHGGQIDYEPGEPHGASFRFRLPIGAER